MFSSWFAAEPPAPLPESISPERGVTQTSAHPTPVGPPRALSVDGRGPLAGVSACVLIDRPDEAGPVIETVRAFGGQQAGYGDATHVVVPNYMSEADFARLRLRLEECVQCHIPIVQVSWLEEVVGNATYSAWDQELINRHVPPAVRSLIGSTTLGQARPMRRDRSPERASTHRTDRRPLAGSLAETLDFLKREHPEDVEAGQMRLAVERSLLDCAVTLAAARGGPLAVEAPEKVLGVSKGARPEVVRAAYREKAKAIHPDKGGDAMEFCRLQQAYRSLTGKSTDTEYEASGAPHLALTCNTVAKDFELREHRSLVERWFQQHGEDLAQHVRKQDRSLEALALEVCDVGSVNHNEQGEVMRNQCFYLSLARSYLRGHGYKKQELESTALHFKRVVEAAVLASHPDWGGNRVGEDVQAFSDFLFFVLDSNALVAELAVAIFDSVSGGVEIYRGSQYPGPDKEPEQRANLLVLKYVPGHYQALVPQARLGATAGPTLAELQQRLDEYAVLYFVTNS